MGERTTLTQSRKAGSSARLVTLPHVEAPSMKPVFLSVKSVLLPPFREDTAAYADETRAVGLRHAFGRVPHWVSAPSLTRDEPAVPPLLHHVQQLLRWSQEPRTWVVCGFRAQDVSAEVMVRGGPVTGRVVVNDGRSSAFATGTGSIGDATGIERWLSTVSIQPIETGPPR